MNLLAIQGRVEAIKIKAEQEAASAAKIAQNLRRDLEPAALEQMPEVLIQAGSQSGSLGSFLLARELGADIVHCMEVALQARRKDGAADNQALTASLACLASLMSQEQLGKRPRFASAMRFFFERICSLGDFDTLAVALLGAGEGAAALACEPRTEGSHSPLSLCSGAGSIPCCELLLSFGADPNAEANLDVHQTALYSAGKSGNADVCLLLMRHGGDPYLKRHDGATILDLSEPVARSAMLALLEKGEIAKSTLAVPGHPKGKKPSL